MSKERVFHEKDRRYAFVGFFGAFKYRNKKGRFDIDMGLRPFFPLLSSLVAFFQRAGLGRQDLSRQWLELVCHDGAYYVVVLGEYAVGGQQLRMDVRSRGGERLSWRNLHCMERENLLEEKTNRTK